MTSQDKTKQQCPDHLRTDQVAPVCDHAGPGLLFVTRDIYEAYEALAAKTDDIFMQGPYVADYVAGVASEAARRFGVPVEIIFNGAYRDSLACHAREYTIHRLRHSILQRKHEGRWCFIAWPSGSVDLPRGWQPLSFTHIQALTGLDHSTGVVIMQRLRQRGSVPIGPVGPSVPPRNVGNRNRN